MPLRVFVSGLARVGTFRLLGAGAVFLLGLLLVLMGVVTDRLLERQARDYLRTRIESASAALVADFERSGFEELRVEIAGFASGARARGKLRYSLQAPDGKVLFDEATHSLVHPGWIEHYGFGRNHEMSLTTRLADGSAFAVAGDLGAVDQDDLSQAITLLGGAVAVLASVYLWLAFRSGQNAASALGGALDRIAGGDLSQRVPPVSGSVVVGELRNRLNQTLSALQKRDADMRTALQVVAHEMRTPLSHIHQRLQTLRDPEASDGERSTALDAIDERLRFVRTSYDAILRLTHLQSDEINCQAVNLAERAQNIGDAYSASFAESGRALHLACGPAPIIGDPNLIDVAIATLLDNALRHTPPGTSVELATWTTEGASVARVRDDGPGMAPELCRRATERFYRGPASTGFGLGLTIVAAVAERLGGRLQLEDAKPGLVATLSIPTAPRKTP